MRPLIIEVPSPLGLRPSGVELAPEVLRAAGLHALLGCDDAQHVSVPPYDGRRDRATGVPGACGLEVTIFNPNLDPDGSIARQLCELIGRCVPTAG